MKKILTALIVLVFMGALSVLAYHYDLIDHNSPIGKVIEKAYYSFTNQKAQKTVTNNSGAVATGIVTGTPTAFPYNWKMEQPSYTNMTNWDTMKNGFKQEFAYPYIITKEDAEWLNQMGEGACPEFYIYSEGTNSSTQISRDQIKEGNNITVNGLYEGPGLGLKISDQQEEIFKKFGWLAFKPTEGSLKSGRSYDKQSSETIDYGMEEWVELYSAIGGSPQDTARYPYNTVFVTSDLLLHTFHKIFSNELKYYEQTIARPAMSRISQAMFAHMIERTKNAKDAKEKAYFEFLAAYRAFPASLFVPNDIIMTHFADFGGDYTDEEMQKLVMDELEKKYIPQLASEYKDTVRKQMALIFKGDESRGDDILTNTFMKLMGTTSTDSDKAGVEIQQDFTQFVPRSHYTTNSLLKTYFIGMKSLMRHKMYFDNPHTTTTAILNAFVMQQDQETQDEFDLFYTFIQKLIGEDDDVNIYDMQKYAKTQGWESTSDIVQKMTDKNINEIRTLRPQRIMGTHYQMAECLEGSCTTEQTAKDLTAGFVTFGEKFTLDSRIFDQMTAGEVEEESVIKPTLHTAMIIPAHLEKNQEATQLIGPWLDKNNDPEGNPKFATQYAYQTNIDLHTGVLNEVTNFNYSGTLYHQWLQLLNLTTTTPDSMTPYFQAHPLYRLKELTTYMGSYTELKHDTLLYVKQSYAEMGAGGESCTIYARPPALPVPKGYVEANIELIDKLIELSDHTNSFFDTEKLQEFTTYVEFVRKIALAQTKNEVIADEDFEKLRLSYDTLSRVTDPRMLMGSPQAKEKRSGIIADIFNSMANGPLYEAVGRPYMLAVSISDANGSRVVIGPMFSHYEFYNSDGSIPQEGGRLTDEDRQESYDTLSSETYNKILGPSFKKLLEYKTQ